MALPSAQGHTLHETPPPQGTHTFGGARAGRPRSYDAVVMKSEQVGRHAGPAQWRTASQILATGWLGSETVGTGARPPWWRTVLYILATGFMSLVSVAFSPAAWNMQQSSSGSAVLVSAIGMLVAVVLPITLIWRQRNPFAVVLAPALSLLMFTGT